MRKTFLGNVIAAFAVSGCASRATPPQAYLEWRPEKRQVVRRKGMPDGSLGTATLTSITLAFPKEHEARVVRTLKEYDEVEIGASREGWSWALRREYELCDFSEVPIDEVVAWIQTASHLNMMLDPAVIEKHPGMSVSLRTGRVAVGDALICLCLLTDTRLLYDAPALTILLTPR